MTKRLISLMLAIIMVFSLCLSACSSEKENATGEEGEEGAVVQDAQRNNLALTIYAITDSKTTEEGLKLVEEKISNYCVAKYKTAIDLRFFTEEEYQAKLNEMYDKFAAEEAAKKQAEKEAAEKLKSEAAYKATLSKEEREKYEQQKRLEAKEAAEEAKKKAEEEAALIAEGKDVALVKDVQMDILYIPSQDAYEKNIEQELLMDLRPLLDGSFKKVTDYVFPSFLTAATVNNSIYGLPINKGISTSETYFVVNKALAEKYNVDFSKVRSISDLSDVFAKIRAGEAGVTPIYGDFDPEGAYLLDKEGLSKAVCVFTDTLLGAQFSAKNFFSSVNPKGSNSTALIEYCKLKADYRQAGYLSDTNTNFFLSVQTLTEEEKAEWEKKGYTTVLYKGADFNTEAALESGLFGISSHCQYPERAMEILQLMYTDEGMRNLLSFGVEDVNYIVRADSKEDNVITIVNDSYTMDYFRTGNALIGHIPDTMDPLYIEKSKTKNLNSFTNPFLGFHFDWESKEAQKWLKAGAEWDAFCTPYFQQLRAGTPNYMEILQTVYDEVYTNPSGRFSANYKDFSNNFDMRSTYASYTEKLLSLDKMIHFKENVSTVAE